MECGHCELAPVAVRCWILTMPCLDQQFQTRLVYDKNFEDAARFYNAVSVTALWDDMGEYFYPSKSDARSSPSTAAPDGETKGPPCVPLNTSTKPNPSNVANPVQAITINCLARLDIPTGLDKLISRSYTVHTYLCPA